MEKQIKNIMTKNVEVVPPSCTVQEAAQKMKELDVGILPVCDGNKLLGAVTDRDIVVRVISEKQDPTQVSVEKVMSKPIVYCFEDQDVEDVVRIMEAKQVRRLVVLDQNKKLVGIASLGDLALKLGRDELVGETLEEISKPAHDHRTVI